MFGDKAAREAFGARLKAARVAQGMTVFALSQAVAIPEQTLRTWEAGTRVPKTMEKLVPVAKALNVTMTNLVLQTRG